MIKISAYLVTLNEEKRLPKTLAALQKVADEIIIVDSGSTDKTEEIAKQYNTKFIYHPWKNISSQKNFAQNQCQFDWVLSLDADEVLSDKLIAEINRLKENPKYQAYKLKIFDMFPGDKKSKLLAKGYNLVRLYNKNYAYMPDDLTHDRVIVTKGTKIGQLKYRVHHYSYLTLTQFWYKLNMYTDELVKTALAKGKKYSRLRLITEFPRQFIIYYFFKRLFVNGLWGFVMATSYAYFRFLKIAKYFEYKMLQKVAEQEAKESISQKN